ncbi:MAG: hypothetical protein R6V83_08750 [Candidatus Thorarchaeota archaeon]
MRHPSLQVIVVTTILALAIVSFSAPVAQAQNFADSFIGDDRLHILLKLDGTSITEATEENPIEVNLDEPMRLFLQVNVTSDKSLNMSGTIWFYYMDIALFPVEVRNPTSNGSWVVLPHDAPIDPVEVEMDFDSMIDVGPVDLATGLFRASLNFTYNVLGEPEMRSIGAVFYLNIPAEPVNVITSAAGIAASVATVGAVYGIGSGIGTIIDGIKTAAKLRGIHNKMSQIKSLPNLAVLGALPALFAMVAGMTSKIRKKDDDEYQDGTGSAVNEFVVKQRLREVAPDAWPMRKCPYCLKDWDEKRDSCKKCNMSKAQARMKYADVLVDKVEPSLKVLDKHKSVSVRKLAKKTDSNNYNAGVVAAALVDTEVTEIEKIETPLRSFVMNLAGIAFLFLTWQQLFGSSASDWQTALTLIGAALSVGVVIALYVKRRTQIEELQEKGSDAEALLPSTGTEEGMEEAEPAAEVDTEDEEEDKPATKEGETEYKSVDMGAEVESPKEGTDETDSLTPEELETEKK